MDEDRPLMEFAQGTDAAPVRLGPRPLALHLALAMLTWPSSGLVSPFLRQGLLPWRPGDDPQATARAADLAARLLLAGAKAEQAAGAPGRAAFDHVLGAAIMREARRRLQAFLDGVKRYRTHPYRRPAIDPEPLFRFGGAALRDYGPAGGYPVLVVPSLINRAYILDLAADNSLMRWLAGRGLRPLLMDWGEPTAAEAGFDAAAYVVQRLAPALAAIQAMDGRRPLLVGYCMGGNLAAGLAAHAPESVAGLALLATPWDFRATRPEQADAAAAVMALMAPLLQELGQMPVDFLQAMFIAADPLRTITKFAAYGAMDPASPQAAAFVALEDWVNDGVPLSPALARDCFDGWYGANLIVRGLWQIAGRSVSSAAIAASGLPVLLAVPERDRIVPPVSALAFADAMPAATIIRPASGHVGMVAAPVGRTGLWEPLAAWLERQAAAGAASVAPPVAAAASAAPRARKSGGRKPAAPGSRRRPVSLQA